jgi:hypothetical protein
MRYDRLRRAGFIGCAHCWAAATVCYFERLIGGRYSAGELIGVDVLL